MSEAQFKCEICGREFKTKMALGAHKRSHAPKPPTQPALRSTPQAPTLDPSPDVELQALHMLEEGHSPIDIMMAQRLTVEQMKKILQDYRELRSLSMPEGSMAEVVLQVANLFGEQIRNVCPYFNSESNVCTQYSLYDVDEKLRRACPTLFKGLGGRTRWHVGSHPWVCVFCRRGLRGGGE
jgi:hypothetical protein